MPDARVIGDVPAQFLRDFAVGVAVRVVPELAAYPGTEYDTESWQGADGVGVGVLLKMRFEFRFEPVDLSVEFTDDTDRCGRRGCERFGYGWWCFELAATLYGSSRCGYRGYVYGRRVSGLL